MITFGNTCSVTNQLHVNLVIVLLKHSVIFKRSKICIFTDKNQWGSKFATCAGKSQSPIDIKTQNLPQKSFKPFIFHQYDETFKTTKLANNGHSVKMTIESLNRAQQTPGVSCKI